jgi:polysaccharide deacetylase family protein (PEP-CTERM system associated)
MEDNKYILLTIDVEDWFQVENFKPWIPFETWDQRELRIERNVHRLLDLFDSIQMAGKQASLEAGKPEPQRNELNPSNKDTNELSAINYELKRNDQLTTNDGRSKADNELQTTDNVLGQRPRATFFILGWLAERLPHLVREIQSRGHEVASHGINHMLSNKISIADLKIELNDSKRVIEDIIGKSILGFRAPSFSINENVLKATEDAGYLYGSSYNSFNMHERYGQIDLSENGKKGIAHIVSDNFFELPLSNLKLMGKTLPWSGGAYFRLIPLRLFMKGLKIILKSDGAYVFYMHPWEIDSEQPRVKEASANLKFRHYSNISKTFDKLSRLIESFRHYQFVTCSDYLHEVCSC